jgi:excisionase family DNA binding protein
MAQEKLLTIREVSSIIGISEKEVIDLAESGSIPAYKVGGVYLRFKQEQIEDFRRSFKKTSQDSSRFSSPAQSSDNLLSQKISLKDKLTDFIYLNDFYILSFLLVVLILIVIISY